MDNVNEIQVSEQKTAFLNENKAKRTGKIMLLVSVLLMIAGTALSAVTVAFADAEMELMDAASFIIGSFLAVFVILLPDCMMFSMINKGSIRPIKSAFAVIINVLMLIVLLFTASQSSGNLQPLVLLSLLAVYLSDVYMTACLIVRRTKFFTEKVIKGFSVAGIIFTVVTFAGVVYCIIKLISESAGADILSLVSSYYASIMYFLGNSIFVLAGVLSLYVKDYQKN